MGTTILWKSTSVSTFGPINFMAADAHEINLHVIDIHRDFTDCLCCIRVEEHLTRAADLTCDKDTKAENPT